MTSSFSARPQGGILLVAATKGASNTLSSVF